MTLIWRSEFASLGESLPCRPLMPCDNRYRQGQVPPPPPRPSPVSTGEGGTRVSGRVGAGRVRRHFLPWWCTPAARWSPRAAGDVGAAMGDPRVAPGDGAVKRHEFRIEVAARLRLSHETVTAFLAAHVGGPPVRRSNASSRAQSSAASVSDMIRIGNEQPSPNIVRSGLASEADPK
jgi:hypothetical protein